MVTEAPWGWMFCTDGVPMQHLMLQRGVGGSCKIRELVLIREKALFGFPGCSVWKCLHGHLELLRNLECMEYEVWSMEL